MKKSSMFVFLIAVVVIAAIVYAVVGMQSKINEYPSMKYETFGGFLSPAYYRHVLVVDKNGIDYTVYAQNGSVTEHKTASIDQQTYNALIQQFNDANFTSLNNTYMPQHPNPDVGSTNISLTIKGITKSVLIKQGFEGTPYPDSLTSIIETMQNLTPQ